VEELEALPFGDDLASSGASAPTLRQMVSVGWTRLPYLSRMCRYLASVVAYLTRVPAEVEGASHQDRPGPGRSRVIPPHRSRDVHARCLAESDA
jgi:hypothetical protein